MILPPYEVAAIVRSTGLEPLGRPVRQGQAYAVRAIDDAGEEVRVIVDARLGRIIKVVPLMDPRYAMPLLRPPAFGRPPRPVAMVPDGGIEGPLLNAPGAGGLGPTAGAPHEPPAPAGPPLPRPRPKIVSTESPPTQPVAGAAAPQGAAKDTKPTRRRVRSRRRLVRRRHPPTRMTMSEIRKMKAPRKPGRSLGSS